MSIGRHVTLMIACEFSGFVLGVLAAAVLVPTTVASVAWIHFSLLVAGAVCGALGARWLFSRLGVRCPRCGGRAFFRGVRPITYYCSDCDWIHETRVRSNW
jgi:hypothetical protein